MGLFTQSSAFSCVTAIASRRAVHGAFSWLHRNPGLIMDWQTELVRIPAPPFGEHARSEWMAGRFIEAGLSKVTTDAVGNVFGQIAAAGLPDEATGPVVVVSAHLDTVFPMETVLNPRVDGDRLEAPGSCDNGAGVVGMLALAHALARSRVDLMVPLIFLGNVGEEGEGDLRGVRHFYQTNPLAGRIAAHIVLDGGGADSAVTQGLGSRRFRVVIKGPGGHSFTDAGRPNPINALALGLARLAEISLPDEPRTTMNVGTIQGGQSVNSIPESAQAAIDFRSNSSEEIVRLEVALHRAMEDAVVATNRAIKTPAGRSRGLLTFAIEKIGDRPAAELPGNSPLLEALRAVDRHLGLRTDQRVGSTDANLPMSLGVAALSMGAGGEGGGAHTLGEWYSAKDREVGLRRVMLLTLAMAEWAAEQ
jgi:acetylornithine deacetylase/succinyl-diaminopimelate desuccinylase-like protein